MVFLIEFPERILEHLKRVFEVKRTPHSIALGFALGFFLGSLPIPGFGVFLAFGILLVYPQINKLTLFSSLLVWGAISGPPIYYLSFKIGDFLLKPAELVEYNVTFIDQVYQFTRRFVVGYLTLITSVSITAYIVLRTILEAYREKVVVG